MQQCHNCKSNQLDGTIFCAECGASLVVSTRSATTHALNTGRDEHATTPNVIERLAPIGDVAPQPQRSPTVISLVVINSGRRLVLDASEDLVIGRKDNARGIYPDVDLGLDGGLDAGVSRRHAIIQFEAGAYLLRDLESANGTFVNGKQVISTGPVKLAHGDELRFGTLILRFEQG